MKLYDLLKDRIFIFISCITAFLIIFLFMNAFNADPQLKIITGVILFLLLIVNETHEFLRKKFFYDDIKIKMENLDRKYLISEMITPPRFFDGDLMCELLSEAGRSMCENIAEYRRNSAEFREFIEMWVHEIKLPVSSLLLMAHNNRSEISEKFLEQLYRIDGYTDTVLYYARSENAEKDYIIKEIQLSKAASGIALKNRETLLLNNVAIRTSGLEVTVLTDGKWLEFILGQLIANSIKFFSPEREPEIFISAEEFSDKTVLKYRDNGIGIPESDIPYIFEKSFTGENGRKGTRSTGMGLYIVKNLCEKMGHKISVNSQKGEFTEFEIIFDKNDFYKFN